MCGSVWSNRPFAIIDLIASGKHRQNLGIIGDVRRRSDDGIGNQVIDHSRAQRSRIPEIVDHDGRRPPRQHDRRGAFGMPLEIDQDVDRIAPDRFGDVNRTAVLEVDKAVEGADEPCAHRRMVVASGGIADHFEAAAVMLLKEAGRKKCRGMAVEITGEVADAQPSARKYSAPRRRLRANQRLGPRLGALALLRAT